MLAVSGGSSPRPFLQTLSTQTFDWARIAVTLVDDRWVPETDSASNSQLVHATLLQNAAKNADLLAARRHHARSATRMSPR